MGQGLVLVMRARFHLRPSHLRPPPFHPDGIPVGSGWKGGGRRWLGSSRRNNLSMRSLERKGGIGLNPQIASGTATKLVEPFGI